MKKLSYRMLVLVFFLISFAPVATYALYGKNCPIDSIDPACQPPTLSDVQTFAVTAIGMTYALMGLLFTLLLVYNGLIYLIGYWEDAKYILGASIEDAQKRMSQWLIGFLMVIISYPLINTLMLGITGGDGCFKDLNNPTIQFIFPQVCNQVKDDSSDGGTTEPTATKPADGVPIKDSEDKSCELAKTEFRVYCINVICRGKTSGYASGDLPMPPTSVIKTVWCSCTAPVDCYLTITK